MTPAGSEIPPPRPFGISVPRGWVAGSSRMGRRGFAGRAVRLRGAVMGSMNMHIFDLRFLGRMLAKGGMRCTTALMWVLGAQEQWDC